jgi:hypothetical protein
VSMGRASSACTAVVQVLPEPACCTCEWNWSDNCNRGQKLGKRASLAEARLSSRCCRSRPAASVCENLRGSCSQQEASSQKKTISACTAVVKAMLRPTNPNLQNDVDLHEPWVHTKTAEDSHKRTRAEGDTHK